MNREVIIDLLTRKMPEKFQETASQKLDQFELLAKDVVLKPILGSDFLLKFDNSSKRLTRHMVQYDANVGFTNLSALDKMKFAKFPEYSNFVQTDFNEITIVGGGFDEAKQCVQVKLLGGQAYSIQF